MSPSPSDEFEPQLQIAEPSTDKGLRAKAYLVILRVRSNEFGMGREEVWVMIRSERVVTAWKSESNFFICLSKCFFFPIAIVRFRF